jgi:hypothetical protein
MDGEWRHTGFEALLQRLVLAFLDPLSHPFLPLNEHCQCNLSSKKKLSEMIIDHQEKNRSMIST